MNRICMSAVALGLAGLLSAAQAPADQTGFEFGVSGLSSHLGGHVNDSRSGDLTRVSDHTEGWALSGAWRFSPRLALDLEYADQGNFDGYNICPPDLFCIAAESPERISVSTWTASMLGEVPISDSWRFYGRLGWARTDYDRAFARNVHDDGVTAGAGLRWNYSDASSLSLEYRDEPGDLERVGLKLGYRF